MELLNLFFNIIESVGIIAALLISIITLSQNNKLFLKKNKSSILTTKRSERIDKLRHYSSLILSEGELCLYNKEFNISNLIIATNSYASLLQYNFNYEDDINLIKTVHMIKRIIINKKSDKKTLRKLLNNFYFYNDLYIAIEFARISSEIRSSNEEYSSVEAQKEEALEKKEEFKLNYKEIHDRKEKIY